MDWEGGRLEDQSDDIDCSDGDWSDIEEDRGEVKNVPYTIRRHAATVRYGVHCSVFVLYCVHCIVCSRRFHKTGRLEV